ncbi:MAG: aminotransferase class I/II-fold pyridoxal phosphate-dependent enzyme [Oscillospiraceae bacterium]|nr:aminotransferase class I/II-fold pyridoxal phosphate-dependent enzyme [Oscillospiraceae bacterium]
MPGHKGKPLHGGVWGDLAALDVTELPQTGDLYRETDGPIREAERLLAKTYGAEHALFLTGGATQGIFAMLAACTKPGDTVITDRLCHQSVIHAMALLDLRPRYAYRSFADGIALPLTLDDMPSANGAKAVIVTSPTYNGVLSDLTAIKKFCVQSGIPLLLDAAHGAHLPFIPGFRDYYSYDAAVMSAHKTLPALGQAAFILTNGSPEKFRNAAVLTGTRSPSYPIMASIDLARAFIDEHGYRRGKIILNVISRHKYNNLFSECPIDPLRVTAKGDVSRIGNIIPEMVSDDLLTFIISLYDDTDDIERLFEAIANCGGESFTGKISRMPIAKFAMTPREAMLNSEKEDVSPERAVGRIAAEIIAPYPPGIPVIVPGEIISEEHLVYLNNRLNILITSN